MVQYGALRRKIGGTYKDFFKSYVEGKPWRTIKLRSDDGFICYEYLEQCLYKFYSGWRIRGGRMGRQNM